MSEIQSDPAVIRQHMGWDEPDDEDVDDDREPRHRGEPPVNVWGN